MGSVKSTPSKKEPYCGTAFTVKSHSRRETKRDTIHVHPALSRTTTHESSWAEGMGGTDPQTKAILLRSKARSMFITSKEHRDNFFFFFYLGENQPSFKV